MPADVGASAAAPVASEVAKAFDLGRPLTPLAHVTDTLASRIWRIETSDGSWAVKEHTRPFSPEREREVFALEIAAADAGVPLPRPVPAVSTGTARAVVATSAETEAAVRVWPWLELTPVAEPTPRHVLEDLGRALAILHNLPVATDSDRSGLHPFYWRAVDDDTWRDIADRAAAERMVWAEQFRDELPHLLALSALVRENPPADPSAWCHMDVQRANWLLDANGELVVIDWDDSHVADPSSELGEALARWCGPDFSAATLVASYASHGGPGRADHIGALARVAASRCSFLAMVTSAALEAEQTEEARAQVGSLVESALADRRTVEELQALIDAASL